MSDRNELSKSKLTEEVFKNLQPFLQKAIKDVQANIAKTGKVRIEGNNYPLPEHQYYDVSVFYAITAILDAVETLEHIQKYLDFFPRPKTLEKQWINQNRWIQYHYSYYLITYIGVLDMSLILVNRVYRLGLDEKYCKANRIKSNKWIKTSKVKKSINDIEQLVQPHKHARNLHVHRGELPNISDIIESESYDVLNLIISAQLLAKERIFDETLISKAYKEETKQLLSSIKVDYQSLIKGVIKLFDDLVHRYQKNAITLHEINRLQQKK